ncbi:MAG: hypothetical protein AAFO58_12770, partial [Pseudomonadota bacterium]
MTTTRLLTATAAGIGEAARLLRDGALVAYSLILTGQSELSRNFFRFCARVMGEEGYFLHK